MSSETYHEPYELLSDETTNMHRALVSVYEELEAIDWYQQRAEACSDPELREILLHNKNEEIEHALMTLEWIRRHNDQVSELARTYLFREGPIVAAEAEEEGTEESALRDRDLGIGSLRGRKGEGE